MISLRLVVDTNIIVSAALKPEGPQRTVLLAATTNPAKLYVSDDILLEYKAVLKRPELGLQRGRRLQLLQFIENHARKIDPKRRVRAAADESDDKFLECAEASRADYLLTGNLKDFPRYWRSTKIVTSREFLEILSPHRTR